MLVLLDTNVVSEPVRLAPEPRVVDFLRGCDDAILSAIVLHEIAYGLERLRDGAKRASLETFLSGIKTTYAGRIVDVDRGVAELAGRLRARASRSGWVLSQFDSLIAATALEKGAALATRNTGDFERLGIPLIDPWST